MKTKHSIIFLISLFVQQGCDVFDGPCVRGKGDATVRQLTLSPFTGVNMTMAGNVTIQRGETASVEIEGQPNILDLISTEVGDGIWTIYPRECVSNYKNFDVRITVPTLESVSLTGSGAIQVTDSFEGDIDLLLSGSGQVGYRGSGEDASVILSGSGKITLDGDFDNVTISHTGSGVVASSGSAGFLKITCSGSGSVESYGMVAQEAQVLSSGSGSCEVYVESALEAVLSGSGSIFYKGSPTVDATDTGSGSIINDN